MRARARRRSAWVGAHERSARSRDPIATIFPDPPGAPVRRADDVVAISWAASSSRVCAKSRAETDTLCPRSSSSRISGRKKGTCGELVMSIQTCIADVIYLLVDRYRIRFAYGYEAVGRVLRGRREAQLLPGGRAARRHPAGRLAAGACAREAARHAAARPLRPKGRADRGGPAPVPRRPAPAPAGRADPRRGRVGPRRLADGRALDRRLDRPRGRRRPRSSSASSTFDTRSCTPSLEVHDNRRSSTSSQTVGSSSASSAPPAAIAASGSSRCSRDEAILDCPPGHAFAGRTVTVDELRGETLILMQEGAGVRQVVEDELRAPRRATARSLRLARARPAGVGPKCGARRLRRHIHLEEGRSSPTSPRARSQRRASVGMEGDARDLARARGGAGADARGGSVRRLRPRAREDGSRQVSRL